MSGLTAKAPRTLLSILAALGLLAALTMPAIAGVEVDWATVTGYADGTSENNHPETWGENCADAGVKGQDTWVLPALPEGQVYSLVVVKAGSDAVGRGAEHAVRQSVGGPDRLGRQRRQRRLQRRRQGHLPHHRLHG